MNISQERDLQQTLENNSQLLSEPNNGTNSAAVEVVAQENRSSDANVDFKPYKDQLRVSMLQQDAFSTSLNRLTIQPPENTRAPVLDWQYPSA